MTARIGADVVNLTIFLSKMGQKFAGLASCALLLVPAYAAAESAIPKFASVAIEAGITHEYAGEWAYFVGGGVAVFDCDLDGDADLYFAGGADPAKLFKNESSDAGLRFTQTANSGVEEQAVTGAYPLDFDSDGVADLALLRVGENKLYRGLGDCRFEAANGALGIEGGDQWTTAFSATWEGPNRLPSLAFGNYVNRAAWLALHTPFGEDDDRARRLDTCPDNVLFRPASSDAASYAPAIALSPGHCTLSLLFSDWNRSGRPDLRVSNDRYYYRDDGEEQLWRMAGTPSLYGPEDGWEHMQIWGMGIASHDVTGDGFPDYFLSSMANNSLNTLTRATDRPVYHDIAHEIGATAEQPHIGTDERPSTAWHAQFADVNNDGWVDLFIAKGNVEEMEEAAAEDPNNLLLGQPDGRFREVAAEAGTASTALSRGGALVDLDRDGLLDIVVVNRLSNVEIFHNQSPDTGHWLQIRLRQQGTNRDAIGAWIEVRAGDRLWRQEVVIGGGHGSGQLGWRHFGLGLAEDAEIRVQWPDGTWSPWQHTAGDRFLTLERGHQLSALDNRAD